MARLIDADKLLMNVVAVSNSKGQVTWSAVPVMNIITTPTVDAVEVVRCRDCKHAYINSFSAASGVALCRLLTERADGI